MAFKIKLTGKLFKFVTRARMRIAGWLFDLRADALGRLVFPQLAGGAIGFGVFQNISNAHLTVSGASQGTLVSIKSIGLTDGTTTKQEGTDDSPDFNVNLSGQTKTSVTVTALDWRELNTKLANKTGNFYFTAVEYGGDAGETDLALKVANVAFKQAVGGEAEWDNIKRYTCAGDGGAISENTGGS